MDMARKPRDPIKHFTDPLCQFPSKGQRKKHEGTSGIWGCGVDRTFLDPVATRTL